LKIASILREIPYEDHYPGPDEVESRLAGLAARHPRLVRRRRVGFSRLGEPIHLVSVGSGDRSILVFAGPHPNEPVGFLTVPYLAELLCRDDDLRLGHTWHFIGCVDPDGARLNEGWFAGPLTRRNYGRRHYRPPFDEQVEWTFPHHGDPQGELSMPETKALADVIDELRPALMCSLHNAEFGGVYYYVSDERPGMAEALTHLSTYTGIPVQTGDADIPGARSIAPGVYVVPSANVAGEAVSGGDGPETALMGASSLHYAARHGTFSLIVEVPMWADPRSGEDTDCGVRRADLLRATAALLADISPRIGALADPALVSLAVPGSPFARSLADLRRTSVALAAAFRSHAERAGDARGSVAEQLSFQQTAHTLRLRTCGSALRLVAGELAVGNSSPAMRSAGQALDGLFETWADEADADATGTPVPIAQLVGAQLGAVLTAAYQLSAS
jgi:hypothetical protein